MIQEDKELLIRDLCARLPYGVKSKNTWVKDGGEIEETISVISYIDGDFIVEKSLRHVFGFDSFKPILFPLGAIDKEIEMDGKEICVAKIIYEYLPHTIIINENISWLGACMPDYTISQMETLFYIFHRYHIDYRGLIDKGLAISVFDLPENPYK